MSFNFLSLLNICDDILWNFLGVPAILCAGIYLSYKSGWMQIKQFKKVTKVLLNVSKKNAAAFYDYITSQQYEADTSAPFSWSPATLYNPSGKMLIGLAVPAYTDYIARMHDLNGMIHLLKLQIEIALNPEQNLEQVIAQSQYTNPYTLEPMSYNKDSHSIYFECMDKHSVCELNL